MARHFATRSLGVSATVRPSCGFPVISLAHGPVLFSRSNAPGMHHRLFSVRAQTYSPLFPPPSFVRWARVEQASSCGSYCSVVVVGRGVTFGSTHAIGVRHGLALLDHCSASARVRLVISTRSSSSFATTENVSTKLTIYCFPLARSRPLVPYWRRTRQNHDSDLTLGAIIAEAIFRCCVRLGSERRSTLGAVGYFRLPFR